MFKAGDILGSLSLDKMNQAKLHLCSPWTLATALIVSAFILGSLAASFIHGGIQDAEFEPELVPRSPSKGPGDPPAFAYWISGTGGEYRKILRLLKAVYHPRNCYLLHLDAGSSGFEKIKLVLSVQSERVFRAFGNVHVMGRSNAVDPVGASAVAATLQGAAILLKISADWDWFITLSASDYPIVTQDDLLHAFASLPRYLNFIDHTSNLGWEEDQRAKTIVVDPNLHMDTNTPVLYSSGIRTTPDAFKVFTGSPWVILSRSFMEYCVFGWDNLPRKLLMYFANVIYPMESYFHTVICNSPEFQNTTISNDLRYILWDRNPKSEPILLNQSRYEGMINSRAAFARPFRENDPVLEKVDESILKRSKNSVTPGKWCSGMAGNQKVKTLDDPCSTWGDINAVKPGLSGKKLLSLVSELVSDESLRSKQCKPQ